MNMDSPENIRVVIMHGKDTDPSKKWYPWLKAELEKRGLVCEALVLPKADDPAVDEWIEKLEQSHPDPFTILVGHSRGGVAILRWLERLPADRKVRKVILVAANSGRLEKMKQSENSKGFYSKRGYDFENIKSHCDDFVVLHSRDDQWVPFAAGKENAAGLQAKFLIFDDRGHFGSQLPQQKIPELLDEILSV